MVNIRLFSRDREISRPPQLEGTVISISPQTLEPADFNWAKVVVIGALLLPLLPILLMMMVILSLLGGSGFPHYMFYLAMHPRARKVEPVWHLRILDFSNARYDVRVKGHLRGNILPEDVLTIWGDWVAGTLDLQLAYNHRTQAYISVLNEKLAWQKVLRLLAGLVILGSALLIFSLIVSGICHLFT